MYEREAASIGVIPKEPGGSKGAYHTMRRRWTLTILLSPLALGLDANADPPVPTVPPPGRPQESELRPRQRGEQRVAPTQAFTAQQTRGIPPQASSASPRQARQDPRWTTAPSGRGIPTASRSKSQDHGVSRPTADSRARRVQAGPGDASDPLGLQAIPTPSAGLSANPTSLESGQSLSLQAALYGALTSNPELVSLRQGNVPGSMASPEAVEVARRFPTTLNPTLWVDVRPLALERVPGGIGPSGRYVGPSMDQKDVLMYFSLRQPIELGHQTRYRYAIAKAALSHQRWTVLQAELLALVQTYRFFQTAAYRREKLQVAAQLSDFNDKLVQALKRRFEENQVPADLVVLSEVENEASRQLVEAARQDYANALTDLRNQIGIPETAGTAEPLGEFILPKFIPDVEDQMLIQTALQNRPEIHAARAQVEGAQAAISLAKGDRIPTPVVGPTYERDEQGTEFVGFVYITPIPFFNNGTPLVRQREAEFRRSLVALEQIQQRTISQVKAATAKWNGANRLVARTDGLSEKLKAQVANLERLFEAGQTDVSKLLQARQRLIQLENARLDAVWQATQSQADLLLALGAPTLINALQRQEQASTLPPSDAQPIFPAPVAPSPSPR